MSLKSLGRKEEPPSGEASRPPKIDKKSTTEAIVVLSALVEEHRRPQSEPTFEVVSVPLDPTCPEHMVQMSKERNPTIKVEVIGLLRQHKDVFVFDPSEIPGIALHVIEHKISMDLNHKLVIQNT